jgi:hypothetical protein
MGRGRAKAKQTKVARELKYHSPNTDLAALQRELGGRASTDPDSAVDDYGDYLDDSDEDPDEDDEDEDGTWAARSRQANSP